MGEALVEGIASGLAESLMTVAETFEEVQKEAVADEIHELPEDTILSNPKKLFSEMLTALAIGFAHYARRNKATGEWLQENYWPGSLGYQWGGLSLAFGDLLEEMACVIRGADCA